MQSLPISLHPVLSPQARITARHPTVPPPANSPQTQATASTGDLASIEAAQSAAWPGHRCSAQSPLPILRCCSPRRAASLSSVAPLATTAASGALCRFLSFRRAGERKGRGRCEGVSLAGGASVLLRTSHHSLTHLSAGPQLVTLLFSSHFCFPTASSLFPAGALFSFFPHSLFKEIHSATTTVPLIPPSFVLLQVFQVSIVLCSYFGRGLSFLLSFRTLVFFLFSSSLFL